MCVCGFFSKRRRGVEGKNRLFWDTSLFFFSLLSNEELQKKKIDRRFLSWLSTCHCRWENFSTNRQLSPRADGVVESM